MATVSSGKKAPVKATGKRTRKVQSSVSTARAVKVSAFQGPTAAQVREFNFRQATVRAAANPLVSLSGTGLWQLEECPVVVQTRHRPRYFRGILDVHLGTPVSTANRRLAACWVSESAALQVGTALADKGQNVSTWHPTPYRPT